MTYPYLILGSCLKLFSQIFTYIFILFQIDPEQTRMADEGEGRRKLRQWDKGDMRKALAAC